MHSCVFLQNKSPTKAFRFEWDDGTLVKDGFLSFAPAKGSSLSHRFQNFLLRLDVECCGARQH